MQANQRTVPSDDRTGQFLRLLGQHEHSLYTFVLAMVPRWADAEDIVQEARIRLWEQFDKYQPDKDFGAWARTIAYYLILAHRKQAKRSATPFSQAFCEAIAAEVAETPSLVRDRQEALLHCLEELDESKRNLVQRYYGGKESMSDLARTLKRSYEALRKAIYRTLIVLGECNDSRLHKEVRP
jgi:RNA polymerase sigma-70 factor (ECF subfamily)